MKWPAVVPDCAWSVKFMAVYIVVSMSRVLRLSEIFLDVGWLLSHDLSAPNLGKY